MERSDAQSIARKLLLEEVVQLVENARMSRAILRTGFHAARLFTIYLDANFSIGRIVDDGDFFEVQMDWAKNIVVGFARFQLFGLFSLL